MGHALWGFEVCLKFHVPSPLPAVHVWGLVEPVRWRTRGARQGGQSDRRAHVGHGPSCGFVSRKKKKKKEQDRKREPFAQTPPAWAFK